MPEITGETRVVGIYGYPVRYTLSPIMHNAAFRALGMDCRYLAFAVVPQGLRQAVDALRALQMVGVNITVPHKERVVRYLDQLSDEAELIGAVNTIQNKDGLLIGHNTDGMGFIRAFREAFGIGPSGKRVLLLGAGGAARAVAAQLMLEGVVDLVIANRTYSRARRLIKLLGDRFPAASLLAIRLQRDPVEKICRQADIVINATSAELSNGGPLIRPEAFRPAACVCDLIYQPPLTSFLRTAGQTGCRTMNGLGMLLHQGALAFQIWFDREPPLAAMKRALKQVLSKIAQS